MSDEVAGPMYRTTADAEYKYFLNDPEYRGLIFFKCIKERHKISRKCIKDYLCDESWDERVNNITIGTVTHLITEFNVTDRPVDTFLEDNFDEDGVEWGDHDRRCDYKLTSLEIVKDPLERDTEYSKPT